MASLAGVEITALPGIPLAPLFRDWPAPPLDPLVGAAVGGTRTSLVLNTTRGQHVALTATARPEGGFVVAVDDLTEYVRLEARYSHIRSFAPHVLAALTFSSSVAVAKCSKPCTCSRT